MSVKISGNKITMTRGDTLVLSVQVVLSDGTVYTPVEGDVVRFAVKSNKLNATKTDYSETEPLIEKYIDTETMTLVLDPEDTKSLGFGTYVWDMQITFDDGTVDTFITVDDGARLILSKEVD